MRRALQWLAVVLSIGWIVVIAGALPGPIGGPTGFAPRLPGTVPDWREAYLGTAGGLGAGAAYLAWFFGAAALGALEYTQPLKSSLVARTWLMQLSEWGTLLGVAVAAVLPPWILWWLARLGSSSWHRLLSKVSKNAPAPLVRGANPALIVTGGWSAVLLLPLAGLVMWQLLHPVPSWLMLPPADGGADAPLAEWCPSALHARARECTLALDEAQARSMRETGDYAPVGARCIPATDLPDATAPACPPREMAQHARIEQAPIGRGAAAAVEQLVPGMAEERAALR